MCGSWRPGNCRPIHRAAGSIAGVALPAHKGSEPNWRVRLERPRLPQGVPWPRRRWRPKCLRTSFCACACYEMSWHKCPAGDRVRYSGRGSGGGGLLLSLGPRFIPHPHGAGAGTARARTRTAALPSCAETRLLHHSEPCIAGAAGASVPMPGHWAHKAAQSSTVPAWHTTHPQFPPH